MYLKLDSAIVDFDLDLLQDVLNMLEAALIDIDDRIKGALEQSLDPDSLGLFDRGEHVIGLAFTACQKYMSSTVFQAGLKKEDALRLGRKLPSGESCASMINAGANYWKHCDEWNTITTIPNPNSEMMLVLIRDYERLEKLAKRTIDTIGKSSWTDYTCASVLASITSTERISVRALIPLLVDWRAALTSN